MRDKIKELQALCDFYHLNLVVKYYGSSTNFIGINDDEEEVFNICVWYRDDKKRVFYIMIDSEHEKWTGGQFKKEDILLFLSIDDLSLEELNIKSRKEEQNDPLTKKGD